jgi:hypothetical protein
VTHYTVIGLYSNGQRFCHWVHADSPENAVVVSGITGCEVAAVIEGSHSDVLGGNYAISPEDLEDEDFEEEDV